MSRWINNGLRAIILASALSNAYAKSETDSIPTIGTTSGEERREIDEGAERDSTYPWYIFIPAVYYLLFAKDKKKRNSFYNC